jgi:hypothetical protein
MQASWETTYSDFEKLFGTKPLRKRLPLYSGLKMNWQMKE